MKRKEFLQSGLIATGLSVLPNTLTAKKNAVKRLLRFVFMSDIHIKQGAAPEAGNNWWGSVFQEFDLAYAIFEFFEDGNCTREMVKYG